MPGMGMYLRPVLQQQLQLAQCISLQLLVRVRTDGEEDVADQLAVLEAMKADFDKGVYTSVPEFLIRVGKRIKKNTRTQGTREIVAALRAIVATCGVTDLAGVLQLIETTIAVAKRHMPPNEELSELVGVLVSEACADEAMRREVYEAWLKTATAENGILAALSTATTACTMESEVFKVFLQEVLSNSDDAHFLEAVTTHMQELTSAQPSVARIKRVMLLLKEYGRLGSHIPIHMPGYKVAAYLDKETSMEHVPLVFQPFLAELDPVV
ncbi:MAG: hypothetical protein Q7R83_01235, partial [bacterium]|nr:hypothetical protein [bacterium]